MAPEPLSVPVPIEVPVWAPSHTSVLASGNEQRKNVTSPLGVFEGLLPVTVAVSCTASPGVTEVFDGVVDIVALHWANDPRTKSFSVAVPEKEERVSETRVAKHSPARLISGELRLTPASKNSPCRYVVFPLLSKNVHGEDVPFEGF